ncbi:MAG: hypothetical protein NVV62_14090 [Terricaulis sp.]|nr:hypothetical protein [Terricaulis sp.]
MHAVELIHADREQQGVPTQQLDAAAAFMAREPHAAFLWLNAGLHNVHFIPIGGSGAQTFSVVDQSRARDDEFEAAVPIAVMAGIEIMGVVASRCADQINNTEFAELERRISE